MLLRSHGGGNCSGDGGAHEGGPDLHPTAFLWDMDKQYRPKSDATERGV